MDSAMRRSVSKPGRGRERTIVSRQGTPIACTLREGRTPRPGAAQRSLAARCERVLLLAALLTFFVGGYFGISARVQPGSARSLMTPLDRWVPFLPASIFVYVAVYFAMLFPLFTVRSRELLGRVALAYAVAMTVAFAFFWWLPVTSRELRPDSAGLDTPTFTGWGLRTLYALDPPLNLFPSLHVAIASLAALCTLKLRVRYRGAALLIALAILMSTVTVKQHFWVDGAAGVVLAALAYRLSLGSFGSGRQPCADLAYSWRGPASYLAHVAAGYVACYLAFRLGVEPWTWNVALAF
jgi:hypothetical protein